MDAVKCELQVVLCKHLSVHFRKRFHAAFGCCAVLEVRVCVCVCGGGGGGPTYVALFFILFSCFVFIILWSSQ